MKKFLLYLIVFVSLFIGALSCVVLNGYNNYINQPPADISMIQEENPAISNLASSVLNSESMCGTLLLTDNKETTYIEGDFAIKNEIPLSAKINLTGTLNDLDVNVSIVLLNERIYIDLNEYKLTLNSNDLLNTFNSVIASTNSNLISAIPTIDLTNLTTLLENIKISEFGNGTCLSLSIPSLCDAYIVTDESYQPKQIMVTNLLLGNSIYTLDIDFKSKNVDIPQVSDNEYYNVVPALNYLTPIINTLTLGDLQFEGKIQINGTNIDFLAILADNKLSGKIEFNQFLLNFEFDGSYIIIDFYGTVFKLTPNEILELLKTHNIIENQSFDLNNIIDNLDIKPTIRYNLVTNCYIAIDSVSIDTKISKAKYKPNPIDSSDAKSYSDINLLIDGYKNIISENYSIDLNLKYEEISIWGRTYLELNEDFNTINALMFEGYINNIPTSIVYTRSNTYININENKFKLSNSSLEKVIEIVFDYLDVDTKNLYNYLNFDITLLEKVSTNGRLITFESDDINIRINSLINQYNFNATTDNFNLSAKIVPNSKAYQSIANINYNEYKDFDNATNLLLALNNTLNQKSLHYKGSINIKFSDFNYKDIKIEIKTNLQEKKIEITLDNLPTDSFVTYLYNTYYSNQKCKIVIIDDTISIYTTAEHRLTKQTFCLANKTMKLSEFSIDNLYDIMSLRKSIINQIKNNIDGEFSTNFSTDCINVLKTKTIIDLSSYIPKQINELVVTFDYKKQITNISAFINVSNMLYFDIKLEKFN